MASELTAVVRGDDPDQTGLFFISLVCLTGGTFRHVPVSRVADSATSAGLHSTGRGATDLGWSTGFKSSQAL